VILYEDLLKRDKLSLDLFWIKDKSLTDTDALPAPEVLATEIADDLEAAKLLGERGHNGKSQTSRKAKFSR
jgi:hypothetical protein